MESLFGRYEAGALLAVERANGGELAPLEQVILAFEALFGSSVTAPTFAEAIGLLVDAGLVGWEEYGLELTLDGRRLLRRSGTHWDPALPDKVAARLAGIGEEDLAPEGELAAPSEDDVRSAMESLGRGGLQARAPSCEETLSPSGLAGHQTIAPRLLAGLGPGISLRVDVPLVAPQRSEEAPDDEAPDDAEGPTA